MIYLIRYDPPSQTVLLRKRFDDSRLAEAQAERLALEHQVFEAKLPHEVLILEGASEEILRRNHARYFDPAGLRLIVDELMARPELFTGAVGTRVAEPTADPASGPSKLR